MALDQRLVRLLSSVIERQADYALARLELSVRQPSRPLPPSLPLLGDASEASLRGQWGTVESSLEEIGRFVKAPAGGLAADPAFLWLQRTYRELDQYARALRWVLTVTERTTDEPE